MLWILSTILLKEPPPSTTYSSGLLGEIQNIVLKAWHLIWKPLVSFSPLWFWWLLSDGMGVLSSVTAIFTFASFYFLISVLILISTKITNMRFICYPATRYDRCKRSYTVSPHFEQLMYFGLVSALFIAPFQFTLLYTAFWFQTFWKNRLLTLFQLFMAFTAGFLSVHFFR